MKVIIVCNLFNFLNIFIDIFIILINKYSLRIIVRREKKICIKMTHPLQAPGTYIKWQLRTYYAHVKNNRCFLKKRNRFVTALDLNKCLKQVKYPQIWHHTSTSISELPSIIITMHQTGSGYIYTNCLFSRNIKRLRIITYIYSI